MKFEEFEKKKFQQFVMVIFLSSAQTVYLTNISTLCASINFF